MDFEDTPEAAQFRADARAWLEDNAKLKQATGNWSEQHLSTEPGAREDYERRTAEWQHTLFDAGWAGITWPTEHGGRGGTVVQQMIFNQEQAAFDVAQGFFLATIQLVGPAIRRHGTDAQKERYLRPLLRGDERWTQLFSEPGAGSDLAALATKAELDGDEYVVTGQKVWNSGAHIADFGILLARTDPSVPKHKGITFFIVDMTSPGIDVRPLVQPTGTAEFNEVFLDEVRIPVENVVGEVNGGWAVARTTLASEAVMISGGSGRGGFDPLVAMVHEQGPIEDRVVRQRLADIYARERILKYLGFRFQTAVATGDFSGAPDGSVMKLLKAELVTRIGDFATDVLGPAGALVDEDAYENGYWQRQFLNQFATRIGGGTSEVHRNNLAQRALGLPREPSNDRTVPFSDLPKA